MSDFLFLMNLLNIWYSKLELVIKLDCFSRITLSSSKEQEFLFKDTSFKVGHI